MSSKNLDEEEKQIALFEFNIEMEKGEKSILKEGVVSSTDLKKELSII